MGPEVPPLRKRGKRKVEEVNLKKGRCVRLEVSELAGQVGFGESPQADSSGHSAPSVSHASSSHPVPRPPAVEDPRVRRVSAEGSAGRAAAALGLPGPERCPALLGARLRGHGFSAGPGACATLDVEDNLSTPRKDPRSHGPQGATSRVPILKGRQSTECGGRPVWQ